MLFRDSPFFITKRRDAGESPFYGGERMKRGLEDWRGVRGYGMIQHLFLSSPLGGLFLIMTFIFQYPRIFITSSDKPIPCRGFRHFHHGSSRPNISHSVRICWLLAAGKHSECIEPVHCAGPSLSSTYGPSYDLYVHRSARNFCYQWLFRCANAPVVPVVSVGWSVGHANL